MIKPVIVRYILDGTQALYRFANGYGASVVNHKFSYGNEQHLQELAVIQYDGPSMLDWNIVYDTPITDGVLGHLDREQVNQTLIAISNLLSQ